MAKNKLDIQTSEGSNQLDEDLLNKFSTEIEIAINKVCQDNKSTDPRMELLVTLGLLAAQISCESNFEKSEFLSVMNDMYDDLSDAVLQDSKEKHLIN